MENGHSSTCAFWETKLFSKSQRCVLLAAVFNAQTNHTFVHFRNIYISSPLAIRKMEQDTPSASLLKVEESPSSNLHFWNFTLLIFIFVYNNNYNQISKITVNLELFWRKSLNKVSFSVLNELFYFNNKSQNNF